MSISREVVLEHFTVLTNGYYIFSLDVNRFRHMNCGRAAFHNLDCWKEAVWLSLSSEAEWYVPYLYSQ